MTNLSPWQRDALNLLGAQEKVQAGYGRHWSFMALTALEQKGLAVRVHRSLPVFTITDQGRAARARRGGKA